jgi:hypothetical protein
LLAEQLGCWAMQRSAKGKTGTKISRTCTRPSNRSIDGVSQYQSHLIGWI